MARTLKARSQDDLGHGLGVTFQQIQKYESGANRISASALFRLSVVLERSVEWFFEGLEPTDPGRADGPERLGALMHSRDGAQMALAMARLSPSMRRKVLAVVRAFVTDDLADDRPGA
ncbi:helix-turn-helix transcriptional regulator [Caulobacter segnis]|uniref:helix-turn-helix domain-containing protein n=1 Tax=Caulobacter segnis TaxID=88688 RepID=UPI002857F772|nr:helix-turn-helix transcriptional regulator [Caulobacter segnis]MDR6624499.1 transcriptional regulator with XRE-family HTH domain [Caulobacter segnis]